VVQQSLVGACPGATKADPASLHLGAVAFIHRFGSSLNTHVHFHVGVVDGVFTRPLLLRCGPKYRPTCANACCAPYKYSGELVLTPLELINRIAQLVSPPRTHRHRYYGVLAPNSPLRAAVTAMAQVALPVPVPSAQVLGSSPMVVQPGTAAPNEPPPKLRPPASYLWAALIARIYEVFPLICPNCGGQMRIIAFITFSADIHRILNHIGVVPQAQFLGKTGWRL